VSENENCHCAGTTKVGVKVMGGNAGRGNQALRRPRKTNVEGTESTELRDSPF